MTAPDPSQAIADIVRADRGRLLSALIARLGDFSLAEDCFQDALESAFVHWGRNGVPASPQGWLLQVARRRAIDRLRRDQTLARKGDDIAMLIEEDAAGRSAEPEPIPDERLRLIFTCCHPALDAKSRVALTLRTLGGLSTADVARAFLDKETTMGQRLSRARAKITKAGIPYVVPGPDDWAARLHSVLTVLYLIFNEGWSGAASQVDLCEEAIWLTRMVNHLCPSEAEIEGALALMLLGHARRTARQDGAGASVPVESQDPNLWDAEMIGEGLSILDTAVARGNRGPFQVQAAISALHIDGRRHGKTDWRQIVMLYDTLLHLMPSPVVRLNRAVAMAELAGPQVGLAQLVELLGELDEYQPFHAARANLLAAAGQVAQAQDAYDRAIAMTSHTSDKAFLLRERKAIAQKKAGHAARPSPTGR